MIFYIRRKKEDPDFTTPLYAAEEDAAEDPETWDLRYKKTEGRIINYFSVRNDKMLESKKEVSLKVNMIMNVILTVSSMLFPIITFPYVSRVVGAEGIGKVTFVTSVVTYFSMFAQLGIPTYGIRACAKIRDNKEELSKHEHVVIILDNKEELSNDEEYLTNAIGSMKSLLLGEPGELCKLYDKENNLEYVAVKGTDYGYFVLLEDDKIALLNRDKEE